MFDVAFFCGTNLEVEVRRKLDRQLVEHYHRKLLERGVTGYSFEQAWHDYRFNLWRPFINLMAILPSFTKQKRCVAPPQGGGPEGTCTTAGDRAWQRRADSFGSCRCSAQLSR